MNVERVIVVTFLTPETAQWWDSLPLGEQIAALADLEAEPLHRMVKVIEHD